MLARYMPSSCVCVSVTLQLSNFVQRETISSVSKGMTNHPWKRGMVWLTWPIFACATVDLEKLRHGTPLIEINNVVVDGRTVSRTLDGRRYTRLKLHQFDLSLYLLQTWLYNISTTNRPSGVWALSFKYVLITDISRLCSNLLSTDARCLVIILGCQRDVVDFAWNSGTRSIGVRR